MGAQQFNSDADRREYSRWVKEMQAKRDQYGWVRWDVCHPPPFYCVETKRDSDPEYIKSVWLDVDKINPEFNVAGLLWRNGSQAQY